MFIIDIRFKFLIQGISYNKCFPLYPQYYKMSVARFIQKNFNRCDKGRQEINRKHVSVFQKRVQTQQEQKVSKDKNCYWLTGVLKKNECILSKILRKLQDAFFVKRRVIFFFLETVSFSYGLRIVTRKKIFNPESNICNVRPLICDLNFT